MKEWPIGWNNYDADAPQKEAITYTEEFINIFYRALKSAKFPWVSPHITASCDGEIVLEWWSHSRKITLYIAPEEISFIKVAGDNFDDMEDGIIELLNEDICISLWQWLKNNL